MMGISSALISDIVSSPSAYEETELSVAYAALRDAELRKHRWNFAKRKTVLTNETIADITAITAASPPVVTSAAHGFANGDVVYIDAVAGMSDVNDRTYTVANQATNTFELSGVDGSAWDAYTSGGKLYGYVPKPYAYAYPLPSDCLAVISVENVYDFDVDDAFLYCDTETELMIYYVKQVTDTTKFDPLFDEALAAKLAEEFCEIFSQSNTKKADLTQKYEDKIKWARRTNAIERGPDHRKVPPHWVEVRR
jgi:hypothetical protein